MHLINKYFLQYMLNNGAIQYDEAVTLVNKYAEALNVDSRHLQLILNEINENIEKHLFRIDVRLCEVTGEKMCIFINTNLDTISKTTTMYSSAELELFKSIITAIMESDAKNISSITCLNLTSRLQNHINKDLAQNKIEHWIRSGYLMKQNGIIYLGARTISELDMYFKSQFKRRLTSCQLCTGTVYYGKICANCNEVLHIHCITKYLNKEQKCPVCKKAWKEAQERIYDESDSEQEQNNDESMDEDD